MASQSDLLILLLPEPKTWQNHEQRKKKCVNEDESSMQDILLVQNSSSCALLMITTCVCCFSYQGCHFSCCSQMGAIFMQHIWWIWNEGKSWVIYDKNSRPRGCLNEKNDWYDCSVANCSVFYHWKILLVSFIIAKEKDNKKTKCNVKCRVHFCQEGDEENSSKAAVVGENVR